MNIRNFIGLEKSYSTFNREERNLAAIFFHTLNIGDNTSRFLEVAGCGPPQPSWEPHIYFEYALLRDLWGTEILTDQQKRQTILQFLSANDAQRLRHCDIQSFNAHFGATPKPSVKHIQSPGRWSVPRFHATIASNEDFLAACKFKWAFNAKPDLVIQTGPNECLCIEAKLGSPEGRYPSTKKEKALFRERGLAPVTQTDLQRHALVDLLGFETDFVFLAQKASSSTTHRFLTWTQAFDAMATDTLPRYMKETLYAVAGSG